MSTAQTPSTPAPASPAEHEQTPQKRFERRSFLRSGAGPMVVFENVSKRYPGDIVGLDDVSISIDAGEFVFLVGPSGSGKSTAVRLMLKEFDATEGRIQIGGRDLSNLRRSKVPYLRRSIGCVFQDFKLLTDRTVYENVAYGLQVIGESGESIRRKTPEALRLVGLSDKADRFPHELSGGEQQRVSIARAFMNHPRLLIADEPTGNLDPETSIGIIQLLYRINRTGTTVVMATHDRDLVNRMQMRVIALDEGRVVRDQRQARYALAD
jgi:cell division transport system ATP-binding protein